MADTTALKNRIRAAIKANNNQEITGPVLQQALLDMVDELNGATETEAQQRQSGDSTLQQGINTERQRAEGAEQTLQQNINTVSQAVNTERQRAEGAEQTIDGKASKALSEINNLEIEDVTGLGVQATEMSIALRTNEGSEQDPEILTLDTLVIPQATNQKAGLLPAKNTWDEQPEKNSEKPISSGAVEKGLSKCKSYNYTNIDYVNSLVKEIHISGTKDPNLKYFVSYCMRYSNDNKFAFIISCYNPSTQETTRVARIYKINKSGFYKAENSIELGYTIYAYVTLENQNSNTGGLNNVAYSEEYELKDICWGDLENAPIVKLHTQIEDEIITKINNLRDAGYAFGGIAVVETNPGIPSGNCFYIVRGAGTYTNFKDADNQSIVLQNDGLYVLTYEAVENNYWEYNNIIGIDQVPTDGSHNIPDSNGVAKCKSYNYTNIDYVNSLVKEIHISGTKDPNLKYFVSYCMRYSNDNKFAFIISCYNPSTQETTRVARIYKINKSGFYKAENSIELGYTIYAYVTLENQNSNTGGLNNVAYSEEYELKDICWGDLDNAPIVKLYTQIEELSSLISSSSIITPQSYTQEQQEIAKQNIGLSGINTEMSPSADNSLKIATDNGKVLVNIHESSESFTDSIIVETDNGEKVAEFKPDGLHAKNIFYGNLNTNLENKINEIEAEISGVSSKDVVLILFMGQSNMAGRGVTNSQHPQDAPAVIEGAGYEFRAISDPTKLYPITKTFGNTEDNPNGIDDNGRKTGGPVPSFVNAFYRVAHTTVIGVSASRGGSSITQWQPNTSYLNDALSRMQSAISYLTINGYNILAKYVVWCQGEKDGDTGMLPATYANYFDTMANALFNAGIENIFLIRIGKYNGEDETITYDDIINEQNLLCKGNDKYIMATTVFASLKDKGLMKDQFHYYQEGYNIAGNYSGLHTANYFLFRKSDVMYDVMTDTLYFDSKSY